LKEIGEEPRQYLYPTFQISLRGLIRREGWRDIDGKICPSRRGKNNSKFVLWAIDGDGSLELPISKETVDRLHLGFPKSRTASIQKETIVATERFLSDTILYGLMQRCGILDVQRMISEDDRIADKRAYLIGILAVALGFEPWLRECRGYEKDSRPIEGLAGQLAVTTAS